MKNSFGVSVFTVICAMGFMSGAAHAAMAVRTLGGNGTYSSASSAASDSVRGSSVSVANTRNRNVASGGTTTTGRVATTPRLSLGSYLTGAVSSSGGALRPVVSGGSSSGGGASSGGTGGIDPDAAAAMAQDIDRLKTDVEELRTADDRFVESLDAKQDTLISNDDIIEIDGNEIFVNVDNLKDSLDLVAGQDGREIIIGSNDDNLLWKYDGDTQWNILISKAEITGPAGPQGEPGEAADLTMYSTTEQMNQAIGVAIDALETQYATKEELTLNSTAVSELTTRVAETESDLTAVQTAFGTGKLNTAAQTIVAAINELKGDISNLPTQGNLEEFNQTVQNIQTAVENKVDTSALNQIAFTGQISNSNVADDAAIAKSKLAPDVQSSLDKADKAVIMDKVVPNRIFGTDAEGAQTWYEIVF